MGFIVLGNEFFAINGRFPIAFTIWSYNKNEEGNNNKILAKDLTNLNKHDLDINWNKALVSVNNELKQLIKGCKTINLSEKRDLIQYWIGQKMYDFKRSPTKTELDSQTIYGGLPLKDDRRDNIKTYGITNSNYIGFMDNNTPVRVKNTDNLRFSEDHSLRVWFRLDTVFINLNQTKIFSGPSDNRSYCAYDLESAIKTFVWFSITKALNGRYPLWANQFDIWKPEIEKRKEKYFLSLCFAFGLAENRCIVTKFEKDNPVLGAPDVFVDNPMSPNNKESFWSKVLDSQIIDKPKLALILVSDIKKLYNIWNTKHCKGNYLYNVGLQSEPYFEHFEYKDFLTPNSGLLQIKKYAIIHDCEDLLKLLNVISERTKIVKDEIYNLLVKDFHYFD